MAHEDLGFVEDASSGADHSDLGFVPDKSTTAGSAALEHFGNAASGGYLPQLQAGTEPITSKVLDLITGNNVSKDLPGYTQRRDENIARMALEQKEHPEASTAGSVGGAITGGLAASALLPELGATSVIGKAGQAALQGGLVGAAVNPGDTAGEISAIQPVDRLKNAATSSILSGGLNLAGQVASKAIGSTKDALSDLAETKAFKSLSPNAKAVLKNQDNINSIGRTLLDEGVIGKTPSSYETLSNRIQDAQSALPAGSSESGNLAIAEDLAKRAAAKKIAGDFLGLKDQVAGLGAGALGGYLGEKVGGHKGAAYGTAIGGLLGSGATKMGRMYGPQMSAAAADTISSLLSSIQSLPESAANPAVISALLNQQKGSVPDGESTSAMTRRLNKSRK